MRLDKFLKVSRLIKRRTIAKEISDSGRIYVNDKVAKSSTKIKVSDLVKIIYGNKIIEIKITNILDSTKKEDAQNMYEILSEENASK